MEKERVRRMEEQNKCLQEAQMESFRLRDENRRQVDELMERERNTRILTIESDSQLSMEERRVSSQMAIRGKSLFSPFICYFNNMRTLICDN